MRFGLVLLTIVSACLLGANYWGPTRVSLPAHMINNPSVFLENLITPEQGDTLMNLAKEMKEFPVNAADLKFYHTRHEHIGEAEPLPEDGICEHPYMIPSVNGTHCILPGRIDIGRHYILGGGVQGLKEPYEDIVSRLLSFGRYIFDPSKYAVVDELFHAEHFQNAAKAVCPAEKQYLDPFQFNFIVQVPGQTVALHVDGVYFWGATRFQFPQWLLAVMQFSGLFQDKFIDQIQVVGYFHRWEPTEERGGQFVYWDSEEVQPRTVPPKPLAGSIVDGSKTVHAATVYRPGVKAPRVNKSADLKLIYVGDDRWELLENGKVFQTYTTDDLRWTIVYRARCFANEEEAVRFKNLPEEETMQLEDVLNILKNDMIKRGKMSENDTSSRLDLAITLMDEYIKYPLSPNAIIPYNYCALPKLFPQLAPVLSWFC